jgi:glyoxylate reductase
VARVYVSRRLLPGPAAEAAAAFDVTVHDSEWPPDREQLLAGIAGTDGAVLMPTDRVDCELLDAAGSGLRIVANHAVGYDNVDVEECTRRGVVVTNTPGVLTQATAELTIALMLDVTRRVTEGDRRVRAGEPWILAPTFMLGPGLVGRRLGIVGLGRIGREVARLAEAHGMTVAYASRNVADDSPWPRLSLPELLESSDVVSLHCPLTAETHHLIDANALQRMQPQGVLVNTTRGPVVDEEALAAALEAGTIAAAGLDVYEREPKVHPRLLGLPNVVLAPHLGSATPAAREAMGRLCVAALRAVLLEHRLPANALNPKALGARVS